MSTAQGMDESDMHDSGARYQNHSRNKGKGKTGRTINRWSTAAYATLRQQLLEVLQEDHPQSVRHLYYRMTDTRLPVYVDKDQAGYNKVQRISLLMRREGEVPYDWIVDTGRFGYHVNTFDDVGEFLRRVRGAYRSNPWAETDLRVEIWVESRSLAGVLEDLCDELCVSLSPTAGFTSSAFASASAERILRDLEGKRLVIYYVGDYDPAGVLIDQSLERELREHLSDEVEFEFVRLGITAEQVAEFKLPGKPRKEGDKRALHIKETVEAEAMRSSDMRNLVREAVLSHMPDGALYQALQDTVGGQARLLELAEEEV